MRLLNLTRPSPASSPHDTLGRWNYTLQPTTDWEAIVGLYRLASSSASKCPRPGMPTRPCCCEADTLMDELGGEVVVSADSDPG